LYLWCPAGDSGPYQAPEDVLSKKDKKYAYWFRPSSVTAQAKGENLSELFEKFNSVPFDDRVNRKATIKDIRRAYVEDFLTVSDSSLVETMNDDDVSLVDLLVALEAANPTDVGEDIKNIALLMFCDYPQKFIPYAQVELVHFHSPEAEGSDDFTELIFQGPIQNQIRDALRYLESTVVSEKVVKHSDRPEADRFYSYPIDALEEILVNSVLHKSYLIREPVEIRVYVDCIKILNFPGPDKSLDMEKFRQGKAIARRYRNRRIGEFLKEIDLSEKRSTGITKILRALKSNGSSLPEFETDDERSYLITTVKLHEGFEAGLIDVRTEQIEAPKAGLSENELAILAFLSKAPDAKTTDIANHLGLSQTWTRELLRKLASEGVVVAKGSNRNRTYSIE
jgi:ATP-dependent DNA helicase RecG